MRRWLSAVGAVEPQARPCKTVTSRAEHAGPNKSNRSNGSTGLTVHLDVSCHVMSFLSLVGSEVWGQLLQVGDLEAVQEAHLDVALLQLYAKAE